MFGRPWRRGVGGMAEVTPAPAASVLLLRDAPFEVLMIRRHGKSSFAPDVWAFPGGGLEDEDVRRGRGVSAPRAGAYQAAHHSLQFQSERRRIAARSPRPSRSIGMI